MTDPKPDYMYTHIQHIYTYTHTHTHTHTHSHIHIYMYIYTIYVYMYIRIYIYNIYYKDPIYTYICIIYILPDTTQGLVVYILCTPRTPKGSI